MITELEVGVSRCRSSHLTYYSKQAQLHEVIQGCDQFEASTPPVVEIEQPTWTAFSSICSPS